MRKYWIIISTYWQRALAYRFTVLAYRVGETGEILILILMWTAIYGQQPLIQGYSLQEMITYLLIGNLFHAATRNFMTEWIARIIKDGQLSTFLIKPISFFNYVLAQGIGRTSLPTSLSILTQFVVISFFYQVFLWNANLLQIGMVLLMIALAFVFELLLSFLLGMIAFWTDEVDGIISTVDRVKKFFSGGYFPLSLLPLGFVHLSYALPFAYTFFVPAQLYLGKIDLMIAVRGIGVQMLWIVALLGIIQLVWRRGLRRYEGVGI